MVERRAWLLLIGLLVFLTPVYAYQMLPASQGLNQPCLGNVYCASGMVCDTITFTCIKSLCDNGKIDVNETWSNCPSDVPKKYILSSLSDTQKGWGTAILIGLLIYFWRRRKHE